MMAVGPGELVVLALMCLVPLAAVVGLVLLLRGSAQKTDMGINLTPPKKCPRCSHDLPLIRTPKNFRQAMWGGWTCPGCGAELDKWGRIRTD